MILDEIVWKSHLMIVNEFDEVEMDLNSIIEENNPNKERKYEGHIKKDLKRGGE